MFTTLQELGAVLSLALAGVVFRTVQQKQLQPHMDLIHSSFNVSRLETNLDSLLSNPVAAERLLGSNASVLPWINNAFAASYAATFQFLLGSCIIAILLTNLLPKHKKTE